MIILIFIAVLVGIYMGIKYSDDSIDDNTPHSPEKQARSRRVSNASSTHIAKEKNRKPAEVQATKGKTYQPAQKQEAEMSCILSNEARGSDRWNSLRRGIVTGSSAYYLKEGSVIYAIRQGTIDEKQYVGRNYAVERALELKPRGARVFAKKMGMSMENASFAVSKAHEKAGFSPDGIIYDQNGKIESVVLVKAFGRTHHLACYMDIDEKVQYQLQFGMFVTGATSVYLVLYNPDCSTREQLLTKKIYRDHAMQNLFEKRFREYENR